MDKTTKATFSALIGYSIFGFSFLFSKTALAFASPFFLLAARFLFAFIALNLVMLFEKTKISFKGKPLGSLLLLGFIQPVCYFIFETYGIDSTSAAFSGVMIGMVPVAGLVFGILFLHEKCSFLQGFFHRFFRSGSLPYNLRRLWKYFRKRFFPPFRGGCFRSAFYDFKPKNFGTFFRF